MHDEEESFNFIMQDVQKDEYYEMNKTLKFLVTAYLNIIDFDQKYEEWNLNDTINKGINIGTNYKKNSIRKNIHTSIGGIKSYDS